MNADIHRFFSLPVCRQAGRLFYIGFQIQCKAKALPYSLRRELTTKAVGHPGKKKARQNALPFFAPLIVGQPFRVAF